MILLHSVVALIQCFGHMIFPESINDFASARCEPYFSIGPSNRKYFALSVFFEIMNFPWNSGCKDSVSWSMDQIFVPLMDAGGNLAHQ